MTWTEIGEVIKAVSPAITEITAMVAAVIGIKGHNKWQAEMIGRRRSEIAEDVLAGFYEARDRVSAILSPAGFGNESEGRKAPDNESAIEKRDRDAAFVPIARYERHREFLGSVLAKRYGLRRAARQRANAADYPFDELQHSLTEVLVSADMLMRTAGLERFESNQSRDANGRPQYIRTEAMRSLEKWTRPSLRSKACGQRDRGHDQNFVT